MYGVNPSLCFLSCTVLYKLKWMQFLRFESKFPSTPAKPQAQQESHGRCECEGGEELDSQVTTRVLQDGPGDWTPTQGRDGVQYGRHAHPCAEPAHICGDGRQDDGGHRYDPTRRETPSHRKHHIPRGTVDGDPTKGHQGAARREYQHGLYGSDSPGKVRRRDSTGNRSRVEDGGEIQSQRAVLNPVAQSVRLYVKDGFKVPEITRHDRATVKHVRNLGEGVEVEQGPSRG